MNAVIQFLGGAKLGIFGAGHLGQSLAQGLLDAGFPARQLALCHGGNPLTQQKLTEMGLETNIFTPKEVARFSKILFYTVRPQVYRVIGEYELRQDAVLASFLAGIQLDQLPLTLPRNKRVRVMPSAPETIRRHQGIVALFSEDKTVVPEIFPTLGFKSFSMAREDDLDAFTAFGPCLQIALIEWERTGRGLNEAELFRAAGQFGISEFELILKWARSTQPKNLSASDLDHYLARAATPGGVTEAVLDAIRSGLSLPSALVQGAVRSRKLRV